MNLYYVALEALVNVRSRREGARVLMSNRVMARIEDIATSEEPWLTSELRRESIDDLCENLFRHVREITIVKGWVYYRHDLPVRGVHPVADIIFDNWEAERAIERALQSH